LVCAAFLTCTWLQAASRKRASNAVQDCSTTDWFCVASAFVVRECAKAFPTVGASAIASPKKPTTVIVRKALAKNRSIVPSRVVQRFDSGARIGRK
jgi:hypothetical protein